MAQEQTLVTIRREIEFSEYSLTVNDRERGLQHSWLASLTQHESQLLKARLEMVVTKPSFESITAVQYCLDAFFPDFVKSWLFQEDCAGVVFLSDESTVPWEWLTQDGRPLCCKVPVSRDLIGRPNSSPLSHNQPIIGVFGDPLSAQQGTASDTSQVVTSLREFPCEVVRGQSDCNLQQVRDALHGSRFSLVHIAAPGFEPCEIGSDAASPEEMVGKTKTGPRWVFLHTYLRPETPSFPIFASGVRWANSLFQNGTQSFLCNMWSFSMTEQRRFIKELFGELVSGSSLGVALLRARQEFFERRSPLAFAYLLVGFSHHSLLDIRPMRVREMTTAPGGLSIAYTLLGLSPSVLDHSIPLFKASLQDEGLIVGSAGMLECDLEFEGLQNQSAQLVLSGGVLILRNLTNSPSSLKVNDLPVASSLALSGFERIAFGPHVFRLEMAGANSPLTAEEEEGSAFCLEIVEAGRVENMWYQDSLVTVGRGPGSQISFVSPSISRSHAIFQRSGNDLLISRLGKSVLAVNGLPINQSRVLDQGDVIQLSDESKITILRIL
jgi:hypothetical protein